jgi:NAD dependent epimerase/dehydratase
MSAIPGRVLVTGAAGFIGSHLVERLVAAGHAVRAFVRYNSPGTIGWLAGTEAEKEIEIHRGDIRDYDSVSKAAKGCGTVFHLAALIGIPYSYESPLAYLKTNVEGSYNILEACRREEVANLLMTSTSEVYGEARRLPIDEDHPVNARSPYAASKIGADQLAASYHAAFGLPLKIVRPFNVFGPRQSARAIIPTIVAQLLGGADTLQLGNVHPTRDWTYVQDAAAALEKIAATPSFAGQIVHVGSGSEISVAAVAQLVARLMDQKIEFASAPERTRPESSELPRLLCDNTKLRRQTGWAPAHTLEAGLKETIDWIRHHPAMYPRNRYVI